MFVINKATPADYPALSELKWMQFVEENTSDVIKNKTKEDFIAYSINFLNNENNYDIFVARKNEQIIASMYLQIIPKPPTPTALQANIAYLTSVYTLATERRQGIGADLLKYLQDYASNNNCELIFVWPSKPSVNWYKRCGFNSENSILELIL